jgi:hypothetical protein
MTKTDFVSWASNPMCHDLTEVRDIKEIQFLARVLAEIGNDATPRAADLIAMRIREIRAAKRKDGVGWDKAATISLMPSGVAPNAPLPDTTFSL